MELPIVRFSKHQSFSGKYIETFELEHISVLTNCCGKNLVTRHALSKSAPLVRQRGSKDDSPACRETDQKGQRNRSE